MRPFTAEAGADAEARVAADLERVVEAVRVEAAGDALTAVVLLGGYARGDGAVVSVPDGSLRGFNDYDLLLVFARPPRRPERYAELSRRLAAELEIDFVDLGLASNRDLERAAPTLFWYELGESHRVLWPAGGAGLRFPRFPLEALDPLEGPRLLLNRGLAAVWGALRLWSTGAPGNGPPSGDPAVLRFTAIAAHKAVLAAGDAALLRARAYRLRQEERLEVLTGRPELRSWAAPGFLESYAEASAFRRRPRIGGPVEVAELWWRARRHHEAGFRAAEEVRLAAPIPAWSAHRRLLQRRLLRSTVAHPRPAAGAARRWLRTGTWLRPEERFFLALPGLYYVSRPAGSPAPERAAAWRRRAEGTVAAWHR